MRSFFLQKEIQPSQKSNTQRSGNCKCLAFFQTAPIWLSVQTVWAQSALPGLIVVGRDENFVT
jgi:hypothetical protein